MITKNDIRKEIKKRKMLLTDAERNSASVCIRQKIELLDCFNGADKILLYNSLPDEVETHSWLEKWDKSKQLFLPVVVGNDLEVRLYERDHMERGAYNIEEPQGCNISDLSLIDLVIVPGIAFDKACNRIGRGKGYYDRLLPQISAPLIGIAYDCQILEYIPTEAHDIVMNMLITPNNIFYSDIIKI